MEQNGNQNLSQTPHLCKNNCGFYGSDSFEGMCSQCFKETVKRKQSTQVAAAASPSSLVSMPDRQADRQPSDRQPSDRPASSSDAALRSATSSAERTCKVAETKSKEPEKTDESQSAMARVKGTTEVAEASASSSSAETTPSVASEPSKKKKNKCHVCRKKVGLTGFGCRCGGLFCSEHRYSDKHDCKFDYKSDGQEQIRKNNPVVAGSKIQKI